MSSIIFHVPLSHLERSCLLKYIALSEFLWTSLASLLLSLLFISLRKTHSAAEKTYLPSNSSDTGLTRLCFLFPFLLPLVSLYSSSKEPHSKSFSSIILKKKNLQIRQPKRKQSQCQGVTKIELCFQWTKNCIDVLWDPCFLGSCKFSVLFNHSFSF